MKVKELIKKLQKVDCDAEVGVVYEDVNLFTCSYERRAALDIKLYSEKGVNDLVMISHIDLTDQKNINEV